MGALLSTAFAHYDPERDIPDLTSKVAIVTGAKYVSFSLSALRSVTWLKTIVDLL